MLQITWLVLLCVLSGLMPMAQSLRPGVRGALLAGSEGMDIVRNQADLTLGNCSGSKGSTVDIEVTFFSSVPVSAILFDVQYNAARLDFIQAIEGPVALSAEKRVSSGALSAGVQRLVVVGVNQSILGNGVVAYLRFRISSDAGLGIQPLTLTNFSASSPQATGYRTLGTRSGSIEVVPPPTLDRISPETGPPRSLVVLTGMYLGSCQNSSRVIFAGAGGYLREVIPSETTARRVAAEVPRDATGLLNVSLSIGGIKTTSRGFTVDSRTPFSSPVLQLDDSSSLGTGFLPGSVYFNRRTNAVYIADVASGSVTAWEAGTRSQIGSVSVGSRPTRIAGNPVTGQLVVCNSGSGGISVLGHTQGAGFQGLGQVSSGRSPSGVAVNPMTNMAVVSHAGDNTVAIIDLAKRAVVATVPVGSQPADVAIDIARNRAFVANSGEATVTVIDLTYRSTATLTGAGSQPRAVEYHLETGLLLVGASNGLFLRKADGGQFVTLLQGQPISDIILHSARGVAFAVSGAAGTIFVLDLHIAAVDASRGLVGTIPLGDMVVTGGAVNPFTNQLILAHRPGGAQGLPGAREEQSAAGGFSRLSLPQALNFPRALFSSGDLLGVAISNPGSNAASLQLTAITPTGQQLQGSEISNPYTASLPAQGQVAMLDFQLFGSGTTKAGDFWFHMTSPSPAMKAFFLTGDFISSIVGTEENGSLFTDSVLPAVRPGDSNIVSIINPLPVAAAVSLDLVTNGGSTLQSIASRSIPAFGLLQSRLESLFSSLSQIGVGGYIRVRATSGVRSYQQFVPAGRLDPAGLNAQSVQSGATALHFAHFIAGSDPGIPYETRAAVVNLESSEQTLTFTIRDDSGALMASAQSQTIPANGRAEVDIRSLFNLPNQVRTQGWLKVESSGRLAGYLTYATSQALAAVVSQAEPRTQLVFSQVAEDGTGYFTGLAILNANSEAVTVNISVFNADGALVAATDSPYTLPPGGRIVDVLNRLVKSDQLKNQRGGYVVVSASQPVFGIEIFGTADSRAFANVPAQ